MIVISDQKFRIENSTIIINKTVLEDSLKEKLKPEDIQAGMSMIEKSKNLIALSYDIMTGSKCDSCILKDNCTAMGRVSRCVPYGSTSSQLMFINKMPTEMEHVTTQSHSDTLGIFLSVILDKLGFKREQVYFTDMVKCYASEMDENIVWQCVTSYLLKEIQFISPKILICEGLAVLKVLKESGAFEGLPDISQLDYGMVYDATLFNQFPIKIMAIYSLDKVLEKEGDAYEACKQNLWRQLVAAKECIK